MATGNAPIYELLWIQSHHAIHRAILATTDIDRLTLRVHAFDVLLALMTVESDYRSRRENSESDDGMRSNYRPV